MIKVIVTYTVKSEFLEENKNNINLFLEDFKNLNEKNFEYEVFCTEDNCSFVHISSYKNAEIQQKILNTPSFLAFQNARDKSGLVVEPKISILNFVGSNY